MNTFVLQIHVLIQIQHGKTCDNIFSASRDKSVKMWKRGNPNCLQEFNGHDLVVTAIDLNHGKKKMTALFTCIHLYLYYCIIELKLLVIIFQFNFITFHAASCQFIHVNQIFDFKEVQPSYFPVII